MNDPILEFSLALGEYGYCNHMIAVSNNLNDALSQALAHHHLLSTAEVDIDVFTLAGYSMALPGATQMVGKDYVNHKTNELRFMQVSRAKAIELLCNDLDFELSRMIPGSAIAGDFSTVEINKIISVYRKHGITKVNTVFIV